MHRPFRFEPPAIAPHAIIRPRLLRSLARRFETRLITIRAGAGLGKTTLLAQALQENRLDPRGRDCWLACEPSDSSASVLLTALLAALGGAPRDDAPTIDHVCGAVWSAAPEHVCIVLDDAHLLETGSESEAVIAKLLDALPENGHLVLAARQMPEIATTRLAIHQRSLELDEHDLLLDAFEILEIAQLRGVAAATFSDAGGWPALVELRARARGADLEQFVWEEVVEPLGEAERAAFLALVAVGGTDAENLGALVNRTFDAGIVAELPLIDVDDRGGLRPHAIWTDLLRARIDPHEAINARARLALILRNRGDAGSAFELLARDESWDVALEALFDACNDQAHPPWSDQMDRWRSMVPASLHQRPEVVYARAMVGRGHDPWSIETGQAFRESIEGFRSRGQINSELIAMVRMAYLAWLRADRETLDAYYARAVELAALGLPVDAILRINRLTVAEIEGAEANEVLLPPSPDFEPRLRHVPGLFRAFMHLGHGDGDAALEDAQEAARYALAVQPAAVTGFAACAPALVAWARGDLRSVTRSAIVDPGSRYSIAERVPSLALAVMYDAHRGDTNGARRGLEAFDKLIPEIGVRDVVAGFRGVAGAVLAVSEGDEVRAREELATQLGERPLGPANAGRAILWWPAVPYLLHEGCREFLDARASGPSRTRALDAARALRQLREGAPVDSFALLNDPEALASALPASLAAELAVGILDSAQHDAAQRTLVFLSGWAPEAARSSLRRVVETGKTRHANSARTLLASVPIPPRYSVRIEVLGPARLWRDGAVIDHPNWRRVRVRQLLSVLVAFREIRRSKLGVLLWPDHDEAGVSANVRMTLSYLQSLLEPARSRGDATWFVRQDAGVISLGGAPHLTVDAWELQTSLDRAAIAAGNGTPSVELGYLLEAVALWNGEYLDDVAGEDWAEPLRTSFQSRFTAGAVRAGELLIAAGRHDEAHRVIEVAIRADQYAEPAHRLAIRARLAAGDGDGAQRALDACRRALEELGVEPSAATTALLRPSR